MRSAFLCALLVACAATKLPHLPKELPHDWAPVTEALEIWAKEIGATKVCVDQFAQTLRQFSPHMISTGKPDHESD